MKFSEEQIAYFALIRHWPHRKRCVQQFFYCCICIRYRGNVFTHPLPRKDRRGTHIDMQTGGRFMKYAVVMGWGAIICVPGFVMISSGIQKLAGIYTDTQRVWWCHQRTLIFQNKESRPRNIIIIIIIQFLIIYVPSQQLQSQLQTQHSVDTSNYIMGEHNLKSTSSER
jgi:hypothetical protein